MHISNNEVEIQFFRIKPNQEEGNEEENELLFQIYENKEDEKKDQNVEEKNKLLFQIYLQMKIITYISSILDEDNSVSKDCRRRV
jgi:hypothetical protein